MKASLVILAILAVMLAALNLLWLGFSSAKITVGHRGVPSVKLRVDDKVTDFGNLRTGETRFLFLSKGDGSTPGGARVSVSLLVGDSQHVVCAPVVGPRLQHLDIVLYNDRESTCELRSPMFSDLIITEFF